MNLPVNVSYASRAKSVIASAITCSLLMVLPACQIPKLRQAELGLGLTPSYNETTSTDNSAQLRVEEFYNDPVLTQLICQAALSNRELKILEEEVQIAFNEILSRRGAFLPLVGFRAGAGFDTRSLFTPIGAAEKRLEFRPGQRFPDLPGDFLLAFNFIVPLDIWREFRNARDAAAERYLAAVERRNYFLTRLVADIADNYYGLMALDQRIETLNLTIKLQQQSYTFAKALFDAGQGNELAVQRFLAEIRKNQSEKLIVNQDVVEVENRINFLAGRLPQPVERDAKGFLNLKIHSLSVGVPAQLLQNRPDIRQAERELLAAGLDVKVARAHFFPRLDITAGVGYQAFNPKFLFNPEALIANLAGELTAPVINKKAIQAEYRTANARQLASVYNYQRVILNAFTEVANRLAGVRNYSRSITIKQQQLQALEASVDAATKLFQNARAEYIDVLFAQRDFLEAKTVLIDTKRRELSAVVNAYQALGGGYLMTCPPPVRQAEVPATPRMPEVPPLPAPGKLPAPLPVPPKAKDAP